MAQINVFVENTYDNFSIDAVKVYNDTIKLTEYMISQDDIIKNSCITEGGYETLSFDIVLTDDEEIHRINKEYRDKDKATDVITFAIYADSTPQERFIIDGEINLGEIIISLDTVKSQAEENNKEFNDELYYIISHGILHLLGYDHQTEEDYNFMVKWQNVAKALVL